MLAVAVAAYVLSADSALAFNPLFQDNCVLQRGVPVKVWGEAKPGAQVNVSLVASSTVQSYKAKADATGEWSVTLPPHTAGVGLDLVAQSGASSIAAHNVAYGEVWVCSGQSNMEFLLMSAYRAEDTLATAGDPDLRMFTVTKATASTPLAKVAGRWDVSNPETAKFFSAVGYYFAQELRHSLKVPVGMIHTSWGGTRIEAWTSQPANVARGMKPSEFGTLADRAQKDPHLKALLERWDKAGRPNGRFADPGRDEAKTSGWEKDGGAGWAAVNIPGEYGTLGVPEFEAIDGGVWFRRTFEVPEGAAGAGRITIGAVDDYDTTYVNGVKVGSIGPESPTSWSDQRDYALPDGLLHAGTNVVAVRSWDSGGGGGMMGPANAIAVHLSNGSTIPLAGKWEAKAENIRPEPLGEDPNTASVLYNAMLAPLGQYRIRGAIWYQGESNANDPPTYGDKLVDMVKDWRKTFSDPEMFFFATQLAPFRNEGSDKTSYAVIREGETALRDRLTHAAASVITDSGEEDDIHPKHKQPVGYRLALLAESRAYGLKFYAEGPRFESVSYKGSIATVRFSHVGAGLTLSGADSNGHKMPADELLGFQIAGEDKVFKAATAKITSDATVEVSSPDVPNPKYVRFAFVNFPLANLWSRSGLPAEPFRTDKG